MSTQDSRGSAVVEDPPIIAHLRDKLAHEHDLPGADAKALFATLVGRSMGGMGVRARILERREDGTKVYGLTRAQAARVVERHDELRDESIRIHGVAGLPTDLLAAGCRNLLRQDLPDDPAEAAKMAAPLAAFGARLRLMRESRDMSMADLARAAEVTKSYIVRMETGKPRNPNVTLAMVERLASALGCSPSWLAFGGPMPERATEVRAIDPDESLTLDMDACTRAQEALSAAIDGGDRNHFCVEWTDDPEDGCEICWRTAIDVLRAAEGLRLCPTCNGIGHVGGGAVSCCDDCGGNGLQPLSRPQGAPSEDKQLHEEGS